MDAEKLSRLERLLERELSSEEKEQYRQLLRSNADADLARKL